jgi:hypothetical protein
VSPLLRELLVANRLAQHPDAKAQIKACGLGLHGCSIWGWNVISIDGPFYSPDQAGIPALILPAFEETTLVDLVAVSLCPRATKTRAGMATCLGFDAIERARFFQTPLHIHPDALAWLASGMRGAVLLDWQAARFTLADVPRFTCSSNAFAAKLDRALAQPATAPQIFVREAYRAAA